MSTAEPIDRFVEKLNKRQDGGMYVIEEELLLEDGVYEGYLAHSNMAAEITESTAHRFISDTEKATWNGKQSNLVYTPLNKAGDAMSGVLPAQAYKLDKRYMERYVGGMTLAKGVANQKFDIQFPVIPKAVVQLPVDAEVSDQKIWPTANLNLESYVSKSALSWNQLKGV
ncbi:hypothetical protein [Paenibacillus sp. SYP-B4298]|uniref:hypothetical protein n=1 Tax=Paenibacillus sp. SYP-B4298 TaxID=2996034 RepID=UPI0022DD3DCB|nr:hypothetical protein [Paenibacillus sp. SYP-B4298]